VTGTNGLVNIGSVTGPVVIALSDETTNSLRKADEAVLTTTPGYTNATAHAESGHGVSADGGFYGGTVPSNVGQGGGIGLGAVARHGGAVGWNAVTFDGAAMGDAAESDDGGAIGKSAVTGDGFAGGKSAFATDDGTISGNGIDAIQLGSGGNTNPLSLQIYGYPLMGSSGFIPVARLTGITSNSIDAATDLAYRSGGTGGGLSGGDVTNIIGQAISYPHVLPYATNINLSASTNSYGLTLAGWVQINPPAVNTNVAQALIIDIVAGTNVPVWPSTVSNGAAIYWRPNGTTPILLRQAYQSTFWKAIGL
jgi:hypothetical protein